MTPTRSPWEPWEIKALDRACSLDDARARLDHRSPIAVRDKAKAEGVWWYRTREPRPWTPAEDRRLLDLRAEGVCWRDIAKRLRRTQRACENRHYRALRCSL